MYLAYEFNLLDGKRVCLAVAQLSALNCKPLHWLLLLLIIWSSGCIRLLFKVLDILIFC